MTETEPKEQEGKDARFVTITSAEDWPVLTIKHLSDDSQDDIFTLAKHKDSRLFLDALTQKGPQWLATQSSMSDAQSVVIQTSVMAAPPVDIRGKSNLPELPHRDEFIVNREERAVQVHLNLYVFI